MSMKQDFREGARWTLYATVGAVVALIVGLVIASMAVFGYGFFTDATADRQGRSEQKQATIGDGNYRIANYDSFFDQCGEVQSIEDKLKIQRAELKTTTDSQRQYILRTNITALESERAEDIRQYNADASKADTKGHFRASDLPYQLDIDNQETTCTA